MPKELRELGKGMAEFSVSLVDRHDEPYPPQVRLLNAQLR
jgi:hypothetical protein